MPEPKIESWEMPTQKTRVRASPEPKIESWEMPTQKTRVRASPEPKIESWEMPTQKTRVRASPEPKTPGRKTRTRGTPTRQPRARNARGPLLIRNGSILLGAAIIGLFVFVALAAPLLAPPDPDVEFSPYKSIGRTNRWVPVGPSAELKLGSVPDPTNNRQLDIWYSLVWGTRSALRFGLLVVLAAGAFGVLIGAVSAYLGGLPNTLLMGLTDAFLSLPLITGVIFFQQYIINMIRSSGAIVFWRGELEFFEEPTVWQNFLVGLDPLLITFVVFSWMPYARLINSAVQHVRREEYVLAAQSLGAGHVRIIFRHLLPNSISPAVVLAARDAGYLVLLQAGFNFIGLGHHSAWGEMLSLGRNYIIGPGGSSLTYWWVFLPATITIVLFGVGWNLLGDGFNNWLNPHSS